MRKFLPLFFCFTFLWIFYSCDTTDSQSPYQDIEGLIEVTGNPQSDTVVLYSQSGPSITNNNQEFKQTASHNNGRLSDFLYVHVKQKQTYNADIFYNTTIAKQKAESYIEQSIIDIYRVIHFFRIRGKKVYLIGSGFGALLIQQLITDHGIHVANKYVLLASRISLEQEFIQALSMGKKAVYQNGNTLGLCIKEQPTTSKKNKSKLLYGAVKNDAIKTWNTYKDLSSITYVYADKDEMFGKPTTTEISFLKNRGAQVFHKNTSHLGLIKSDNSAIFAAAFDQ